MEPGNMFTDLARRQIEFARNYTLSLLGDLDADDWFRQPDGVTHLAWQIGHLAMAQYMLTLFRLRGKQPSDEELISKAFLKRFVKGSRPDADPAKYPPPAEIRATFDAVYAQLMRELPDYRDDQLQTTVVEPYALYNNTLGSLLFCAAHEMLHAGQIGLVRRLLGKPPVR
jgi:hypothetical protein